MQTDSRLARFAYASRFAARGLRCSCAVSLHQPPLRVAVLNFSCFNTRWKHGWDSRIRTYGMTESKSVALPLGYIPIKASFHWLLFFDSGTIQDNHFALSSASSTLIQQPGLTEGNRLISTEAIEYCFGLCKSIAIYFRGIENAKRGLIIQRST